MYIISPFWTYFYIFKMTKGTLACWGSVFYNLRLSNSPPRCVRLRSPYISVGQQTLGFSKENKLNFIKLDRYKNYGIFVLKLHITKEMGEFYPYEHYIYQKEWSVIFHLSKRTKTCKIVCKAYGYMGGKAIKKSKKIKIKVRITLGG